jgi:hypothetical protein
MLEHPPHVIRRTLRGAHNGQALAPRCVALVLDGEQGSGGTGKARHVALTELCEGLVGSPLQGVIEVIDTGGHGTRESPCGQNGGARLRTCHNGAICQPRG